MAEQFAGICESLFSLSVQALSEPGLGTKAFTTLLRMGKMSNEEVKLQACQSI